MANLKPNPAGGAPYIGIYHAVLAGGPTLTVNGRTYAAGAVVTLDSLSLDVAALISAGWVKLAEHSGTTAQRPVETEHGSPLLNGYSYLDTTLGKVVIRSNRAWLDINTGLAA
jgi:hypothetical protein